MTNMPISINDHPGKVLPTTSVQTVGTVDLSRFAHTARLHDDITIDGDPHVVDWLDETVLSVAVDRDEETRELIVSLITKRTIHMHKGHT